ncbi:Crp/Fnr family transcriptional regulator [Pendulispora albinea]|uniref:Crp/Fnr family transcriptional regulator n=1 Tax=Pendulispora albinea TaxID=2741071 RepID=A0ABZ2MBM4_9BACT
MERRLDNTLPRHSDRLSVVDGELGPAEQARLISRYGRRVSAGETIFREGEPASEAYLVQEGRIRLLKRVRMVERSLLLLKPGDLFGEAALLGNSDPIGALRPSGTVSIEESPARVPPGGEVARNSTAVALTDATLLVLGRSAFRGLVENYPGIATRVIEQLVFRVRDAEDQIEIMLLRDTQLKIVSALLKLAQRALGAAEIAMSPVELSSRVGLDVDTVKRTVQRLREQQYVRIVGERIEIPDVEALRRLYVLLGTKDEIHGDGRDGRDSSDGRERTVR